MSNLLPRSAQLLWLIEAKNERRLTPEQFRKLSQKGWVKGTPTHPVLTPDGAETLRDRLDVETVNELLEERSPLLRLVVVTARLGGTRRGREVHCRVDGCTDTEAARGISGSSLVAYFESPLGEAISDATRLAQRHIARHARLEIPGRVPRPDAREEVQ